MQVLQINWRCWLQLRAGTPVVDATKQYPHACDLLEITVWCASIFSVLKFSWVRSEALAGYSLAISAACSNLADLISCHPPIFQALPLLTVTVELVHVDQWTVAAYPSVVAPSSRKRSLIYRSWMKLDCLINSCIRNRNPLMLFYGVCDHLSSAAVFGQFDNAMRFAQKRRSNHGVSFNVL